MLELTGVSKIFQTSFLRRDRIVAVDRVFFRLKEGEILGLVGESGCGKSTLGRLAVKLLQPSGGHIFLDGKDVMDLPERQFREYRQRVQIVFQHPESAINPYFTLMDLSWRHSTGSASQRVIQKVIIRQCWNGWPMK